MTQPPTALILAVGEEILQGRVVDTNSGLFARILRQEGFEVRRMLTLGDDPDELGQALESHQGAFDLILSTGGLGPTVDDRVRAEAAQVAGKPLVPVTGIREKLAKLWARQRAGETATESFLRQASVPEGAVALANAAGTALGFALTLPQGARLLCLPGPPREAEAAFWDGGGLQELHRWFGPRPDLAYRCFHASGLPESVVESQIRDLLQQGGNPRLGITADARKVTISALARSEPARSAEHVLDAVGTELKQRLGDVLWGQDDQTLESVVVELLRQRKETVAVAESCTGGRLVAALTAVPGASRVFEMGFIAYANRVKEEALAVPRSLLEAHGAVSAQVAAAMAAGVQRRAASHWGLATTGIAGPDGGTPAKPVGLVFIGVAGPTGNFAVRRRCFARAGRSSVQQQSVRDALEALRREVLGLARLPERA
ncbi:MAG: nicotinamide-nucleotide amidohydrolase family protein [Planctomycetota bacterium]|nr:MAG: nicotinamide-nucleotide amidohydrolase family protein [Planctomycetota bacterium]